MFQKIHFIKIYDFNYINAGDIFCSPYLWFHNFFDSYSCISHCISSIRYEQISKNDIVIIGGGGLLNYNPWFNFNEAINKVVNLCDNVIIWGAGFNSNMKNDKLEDYNPQLDFSKFILYGLRDYNVKNINYTPCSSCMNPLLKTAYIRTPSKKIGSMLHPLMNTKKLPLEMDNLSHFSNIEMIMNFIAEHEVIVTNSYHCALWAMLANRKVVAPSDLLIGNKFYYFRHSPSFCDNWQDKTSLSKAIDKAEKYPYFLDESQKLTLDFFEKVKAIVSRTIPIPNKDYEHFFEQSMLSENYWMLLKQTNKYNSLLKKVNYLEEKISKQNEMIAMLMESNRQSIPKTNENKLNETIRHQTNTDNYK